MAAMTSQERLLLLLSKMYDSRAQPQDLNLTLDSLRRELALDGVTLVLTPRGAGVVPAGWHYYDAGRRYRDLAGFTSLLAGRCPLDADGRHFFNGTTCAFLLSAGQEAGNGILVVQTAEPWHKRLALLRLLAVELALWQQHYWSLHGLREQNRSLRYLLNATDRPQLLVSAEGRMGEANRAGRELLRREQGIRLDDSGQVQVCLSALPEPGCWRSLVLLARGMTEDRQRLVLDTGQGALVMHVMPLRNSRSHWLLTLKDPDYQPSVDADSLACLFALTRTETELIILLGKGCNSREIADYRRVSIETVRSALKSIFHKTGCHRQSDLLLLMQAMG